MAELLDSRDPQAQLRAAWVFGYFTLFVDADCNIGHEIGPWASEVTRRHMPRADSFVEELLYPNLDHTAGIFYVLEIVVVGTSIRSRFRSSMRDAGKSYEASLCRKC